MLSDRGAPLHPLGRPGAAGAKLALGGGGAEGGERQAPGVEGDQRQLEPEPLPPEEIPGGHPDVAEAEDAIRDRPHSHEVAHLAHLDPGPRSLDDEGADRVLPPHPLARRGARHHDEEVGARPVGGPELLAIERVVRTVGGGFGEGGHVGRVGADHLLCEREGRELAPGGPGKVRSLLLLGAEEDQRRWQPNRLMGREEGPGRGAATGHQSESPVVRDLREAKPAVLARDLDSEGSQLGEPLEYRVGHPPVPVEGVAIHMLLHEVPHRLEEGRRTGLLLRVLFRVRGAPASATAVRRRSPSGSSASPTGTPSRPRRHRATPGRRSETGECSLQRRAKPWIRAL